jgi:uncharacterized circularly permuted ATP-grasp superfamily protein/uncharacterized alpha-E superfamily protein
MPDRDAIAETAAAPPGAFDAWDEMASGAGAIRTHWQSLFAVLAGQGAPELAARGERLRQQLEDDGVTFNLYAADGGGRAPPGRLQARPWTLDAVPLVLAADEWRVIERGVAQRARLLDRVLADLYGAQDLLAERRYPPALVHRNPEFLRPCRRDRDDAPGQYVQHYAADLARGPDGVWRVVADRLQAPAGAAFALHHRRAMARAMGEAFAACRPTPLAGFFETWAADLRARAALGGDNPRIVVLTPGPFNEAHAEHAALARELGATLAQGADLTMRDGRVHLKTLGGLDPVGAVLRRVDAAWCDPLELRPDSALGVAGLVQAARGGGVAVANALGVALAEAPALAAFLPRLAERLLGETLQLPSVAAWWCGQSYALREVLDRLPELTLRPALAPDGLAIDPSAEDRASREAILRRLRDAPGDFVAQERIVASQAPCVGALGLQPRPVILRVFATADGDGHAVMPGGLARVPSVRDPLRAGLQQGGVNKDVWILGDGPSPGQADRRGAAPAPVAIRRSSGEVPSRAADDLFWLGRSVERLDCCGRALRAALQRVVAGIATPRDRLELEAALRLLERAGVLALGTAAAAEGGSPRAALLAAFAPGSLLEATLTAIERLASAARDRFSVDMRRTLGHLLGGLRDRLGAARDDADRMLDLLDELVRLSAAVAGLASENMTRGSGWRFLDLGRRVERGIHVARVARCVLEIPVAASEAALRLALELCDSTITYRTRYLAALLDAAVMDLVLLDPGNPQSLAYQIDGALAHLGALPPVAGAALGGEVRAALGAVAAAVVSLDGDEGRGLGRAAGLGDALQRAEAGLMALSDALGAAYFSHVGSAGVIGAS